MASITSKNKFLVSTDPSRLDIDMIHQFLSERSYWAAGVPKEVVKRSIMGSLCFGVFHEKQQVGFARVISDYSTMAYLADVFILENYRGNGLGKLLIQSIIEHPDLKNLRRWLLGTFDAHGLYSQYGFTALKSPERYMERINFERYK